MKCLLPILQCLGLIPSAGSWHQSPVNVPLGRLGWWLQHFVSCHSWGSSAVNPWFPSWALALSSEGTWRGNNRIRTLSIFFFLSQNSVWRHGNNPSKIHFGPSFTLQHCFSCFTGWPGWIVENLERSSSIVLKQWNIVFLLVFCTWQMS